MEYKVTTIEKNDVYKVRFKLGFRIQQKISYYLRVVIQEMLDNHEIDLDPYYHAFSDKRYLGDFRFVLIEEEITQENELPLLDNFVLNLYGKMKFLAGRPEKWFGLDESMVTKELVPVIIKRTKDIKLTRIK
jgi:KUP system potassium uptake protein